MMPPSVKNGAQMAGSKMLEYKEGEEKVDTTFITGTNA
jgi:hypothetical protein